MDIRTQKEKERDKRNASIRREYEKLRSEMPDTADLRLFSFIAKKYNLSAMTVRNVCK